MVFVVIPYYIVLGALWLLALPFLLLLSRKTKYRHSIPSRFFLWKNRKFDHDGVWIHGCSLGEIRSLKPLIETLGVPVSISTITKTGYDAARELSQDVRYLPFEVLLPFWVKRFKVLVVTEAELWLMLFFMAKVRKTKTILINARISDRSYHSYQRFSWLYKAIFSNIDEVFAQSEKDKERLLSLGAKCVHVNGNIKTASLPSPSKVYAKPDKKVWTCASTHEEEEALLLNALTYDDATMLIFVPRHPERFSKVDRLLRAWCEKQGKSYAKMSEQGFIATDVFLCDVMGELVNLYAITDVTFLGGSFVRNIGGHNPLEPAFFNTVLISGPYIFNQEVLFPLVDHVYFSEVSELSALMKQPLLPSRLHVKDALHPVKASIAQELEKK